ncbi:MAG: hypothetical protein EA412_05980 [Chitinophagaceae bacterium]|nr:MAG: hypothetical protein EA412_05980 [Chitinophagaceae bacterium]
MPKKKSKEGKPQVNKDLEGFEIHINEFGQIISNYPVHKLNTFLNKNVDDKKLRDREDLEELKEGKKSKESKKKKK